MAKRLVALLAGAALAASCLVGVGDVEDDGAGTGGSDASAGGSGGSAAGASGGNGAVSGGSGGSAGVRTSGGGSGGSGAAQGGSGGGITSGGSGGVPGVDGGGGASVGGQGGGAYDAGPVTACQVPEDNFDDGIIGGIWKPFGNFVVEAEGRLKISGTGAAGAFIYSGVTTAKVYDLRACSIAVEVPVVLLSMKATSVYMVWSPVPEDQSHAVVLEWNQGALSVGAYNSRVAAPYSLGSARWWRIRADADSAKTAFEISGNGATWTVITTINTPSKLANASVEIGAGTWSSAGDPLGTAAFDNFNP